MMKNRLLRSAGGGVVETDPYWSNVVLLLTMDGADGSTAFTDLSNSSHTVTAYGGAAVDTAIVKNGTGSLLLDGVDDYLDSPDSDDWSFGSSPMTIELWAYFPTLGSVEILVSQWLAASSSQSFLFYKHSTNVIKIGLYDASSTYRETQGTTSLSANTWYHIAATYDGTDLRLFLDGNLETTLAINGFRNIVHPLNIGRSVPSSFGESQIDSLRITKGVARYTSSFTPPTGPFPTS